MNFFLKKDPHPHPHPHPAVKKEKKVKTLIYHYLGFASF